MEGKKSNNTDESTTNGFSVQAKVRRQKRLAPSLKEQEQVIYRRLLIIGSIIVLVIVVLLFWGLQLFVRLAEFLGIFWSSSSVPTVSQDVIPPFTPILEGIPTATNSARLPFKGVAEAGSSIEIFLNGELKKKLLVGQDGNFSVEDLGLTEGENEIEVRSSDSAGNVSSLSSPSVVIYDKTPPPLEVTEPQDRAVFVGDKKEIKIAGQAEPQTTVTVNSFWAIIDQDGRFSYIIILNQGENKISIIAQDIAGNKTERERTVFYNP
ncbi:hypothetical protein A2Z23_00430 [Candidatus Curtissbacteria bacterium RBG_16_39_7]|uniref:Uncharacterized protein n=1 Tax=Candidatus Curtissbacteria bacterium RBG_16_39_7 TaxID=1797707 RepID=A0A1F5G2L9_9BACT|nr:MAG: hypothetical protein A2Z23_00430 [Candidatus Curtissbacteria bacterium RBG_16_39_7]